MRASLVLLLAVLALAPAQASTDLGVSGMNPLATAAGTVSMVVTDLRGGGTICAGPAAFAVEVVAVGMTADGGLGGFAWDTPTCATPGASGAGAFTAWCTDACFDDCVFVTRTEISCWRDYASPDGSWGEDAMTLHRDGRFSFTRAARELDTSFEARAEGVLLVPTWPGDSWA